MTEETPTLDVRPSAYAWIVVGLLWMVALLNYMDRLMITTMRDPIRADIPMTDKQFALLMSAFLWVYAAISPLGGFLADRIGRRVVIIASLLIWSGATCATGLAHSFEQLLAARALMGLSEACYIPAALALIADYHRGSTRSLATGLHMMGLYTGAALGGVGGYLAEHIGWATGFKLFGVVGIAYCLVLWALLRDLPRNAASSREQAAQTSPKPQFSIALRALFQQPGFWILLLLNVMTGSVNWTVNTWMPTFLKDQFQMGLAGAGFSATGYAQAASFVGVFIAGAIADQWSRSYRGARAMVPAVGYLIAGPFLIMAASTHLLPLAILGLIVFGLARGANDANQMPLLRNLVNERYSATGYGFLNLIGTSSGGIMVYIGGALQDAHVSLARAFQVCGAGLLLAGLLLLLIQMPAISPKPR